MCIRDSIKPVMLADSIGDAFRLYLAGAAVGAFRHGKGGIMQLSLIHI